MVELLPQGCQYPPLLDPSLPDQADGLLRLLVVLGAQLSDVKRIHPQSLELVLGSDLMARLVGNRKIIQPSLL